MGKKEEFIKRAKSVHGDKYDYSLVEYRKGNKKDFIICPEHGRFEQVRSNHLQGKGCSKCNPKIGDKLSTKEFITRAKEVHGDEYDYSFVDYKSNKHKIVIICLEHGEFKQEPRGHLEGYKCPACKGNKKLTTEEFIIRASEIHDDKYDYIFSNVNGSRNKVKIICPTHGEFMQVVDSHLRGHGCPKCNESKGEKLIKWYLDKIGIEFQQEKTFDGCVDIRKLRFDFYLPNYNSCIEFDGIHHFEVIEYGDGKLKDTIKKDNIKNKFCNDNNIPLLRIKYTDIDNISTLIETFIG